MENGSTGSYDVIVIGGGLLGCFAAMNLTRYDLSVALLEKRDDLCTGISRANTAIVYSGCDTKPGTRKTAMCVTASQGFAELCDELGVRYSQCGSIMISFGNRGDGVLRRKFADGTINGVRGMKLLSGDMVLELEPNIAKNVRSGLFIPETGTVMPWELCFAAAENAKSNGVDFFMGTEVFGIEPSACAAPLFHIRANKGVFHTGAIVNCAGMASDTLLEMISDPVVRIVPKAGDYLVLDTKAFGHIRHVIFHEPEVKGKGLTLVPTVDGNILIGPTEREVTEREMTEREMTEREVSDGIETKGPSPCFGYPYETAHEGLEQLRSLTAEVVPSLSLDHVIRSFGAVRPNPYMMQREDSGELVLSDKSVNDFCIVESSDGRAFSLVGVKTPGLTCADELGKYVAGKIATRLGAGKRDFKIKRTAYIRANELPFDERKELVCCDHAYGAVVCRCRGVSEGEILEAIREFPGATTQDSVRRRTGAGAGRCQGSFCGQSVREFIAREVNAASAASAVTAATAASAATAAREVNARKPNTASAGEHGKMASEGRPFCVKDMELYDVVVIGGGPAGMAAALAADEADSTSASRSRVLLIERAEALGGILNQCTHSGFGLKYFGAELTGQEYARRFVERVGSSDIEVLTGAIVLSIGDDKVITLSGKKTGLARVRAKAVVLATGCRERPIGALPVAGTRPEGIYAAGAAQKMINLGGYDLGNRFVILGSGDVGMIVARELAKRGKEVIAVVEKESRCGGLARNRVNCLEKYGIPLIMRSTVSLVHGMPRITGVTITNPLSLIKCDTLITSVGLVPERELIDPFGGVLPDWLFVCGNANVVHDIVDGATLESERIGQAAAVYCGAL